MLMVGCCARIAFCASRCETAAHSYVRTASLTCSRPKAGQKRVPSLQATRRGREKSIKSRVVVVFLFFFLSSSCFLPKKSSSALKKSQVCPSHWPWTPSCFSSVLSLLSMFIELHRAQNMEKSLQWGEAHKASDIYFD